MRDRKKQKKHLSTIGLSIGVMMLRIALTGVILSPDDILHKVFVSIHVNNVAINHTHPCKQSNGFVNQVTSTVLVNTTDVSTVMARVWKSSTECCNIPIGTKKRIKELYKEYRRVNATTNGLNSFFSCPTE